MCCTAFLSHKRLIRKLYRSVHDLQGPLTVEYGITWSTWDLFIVMHLLRVLRVQRKKSNIRSPFSGRFAAAATLLVIIAILAINSAIRIIDSPQFDSSDASTYNLRPTSDRNSPLRAGAETILQPLQFNNTGNEHSRSSSTPLSSVSSVVALEPDLLLSVGRPVTADVAGNLGPPSVVTDARAPLDWLRDRWQAAANMQGVPIPGEHWIEVDLGRRCTVSRVLLDWEAAWSSHWVLQVRDIMLCGALNLHVTRVHLDRADSQ